MDRFMIVQMLKAKLQSEQSRIRMTPKYTHVLIYSNFIWSVYRYTPFCAISAYCH